jgi:hypothetical protein
MPERSHRQSSVRSWLARRNDAQTDGLVATMRRSVLKSRPVLTYLNGVGVACRSFMRWLVVRWTTMATTHESPSDRRRRLARPRPGVRGRPTVRVSLCVSGVAPCPTDPRADVGHPLAKRGILPLGVWRLSGLVLEGPCATGEHAAKANQTQRESTEESADRSNASHRREDHVDREKDPDMPGRADVPGERRHEE